MEGNAPEIIVARGKIPIEVDTSKWDDFIRRANEQLDALRAKMDSMGGVAAGGDGDSDRIGPVLSVIESAVGRIADKVDAMGDGIGDR